jgi:hypothetical protein
MEPSRPDRNRSTGGLIAGRRVVRHPMPAHNARCHASSRSPTLGPVGQVERHVAEVDEESTEPAADIDRNRRPRVPRTTVSRNRNSATADSRAAGRRARATRHELELGRPGRPVDHQPAGARPARRPAGMTTLPSGCEEVVDEVADEGGLVHLVADRPEVRGAAHDRGRAGWRPTRRRTSAMASPTAAPGASDQAPPAATTQVGDGPVEVGGPRDEPRQGRPAAASRISAPVAVGLCPWARRSWRAGPVRWRSRQRRPAHDPSTTSSSMRSGRAAPGDGRPAAFASPAGTGRVGDDPQTTVLADSTS